MKIEDITVRLTDVLHIFADLSDMRDFITGSHGQRVALLSELIADIVGLSEDEKKIAYYSGLVHDLGKFAVPELILFKPGRLSDDEYEIIKKHSIFTRKILERIIPHDSKYTCIADYASQHHERIDGSGYPDNMRGDELDIVARIVAVSDVFDVITARRLYNPKENLFYACNELIDDAKNDKLDMYVVRSLMSANALDVVKIIDYDILIDKNIHSDILSNVSIDDVYMAYDRKERYSSTNNDDTIIKEFEYYYYGVHRQYDES